MPDAEELLVKAKLAMQIARIVKARGLTQSEAAALIESPEPNSPGDTHQRWSVPRPAVCVPAAIVA